MGKAVIIYGPQGCGKSQHGAALAAHFGKTEVVEAGDLPSEFWKGAAFGDHALVLTNDKELAFHHSAVHDAVVYEFSEAALDAGLADKQKYTNETLEGVVEGYGATRVRGTTQPHVYVWDSDGDSIFTVAVDYTAQQVNTAIRVYEQGFRRGENRGIAKAQATLRKALGLPD